MFEDFHFTVGFMRERMGRGNETVRERLPRSRVPIRVEVRANTGKITEISLFDKESLDILKTRVSDKMGIPKQNITLLLQRQGNNV